MSFHFVFTDLICLSKLCVFDGIFFPGTRKQKYIDLNVSLVFASLLLKLSRLDNIFFFSIFKQVNEPQ